MPDESNLCVRIPYSLPVSKNGNKKGKKIKHCEKLIYSVTFHL